MEHLSNDQEDLHNQHKDSHKLCNETGHSINNLMKSKWKLRSEFEHDQNFSMVGKPL